MGQSANKVAVLQHNGNKVWSPNYIQLLELGARVVDAMVREEYTELYLADLKGR